MKTALSYFKKNNSGFTLIELLVVILIISALAVVAFAALNPAQRLEDSRDARRTADVDSILTAIHQYIVDQKGVATGLSLSTLDQQLGTATTGCAVATGGCSVTAVACLNIASTTLLGKYLASIPTDPLNGTAAETNYSAVEDANGIVTVKACGTEGTTNISASR